MKEITREVVTTEVKGYEANDGTWFNNKEACIEYENSKVYELKQMYKKCVIAETTEYGIFDMGSDDDATDIVLMKSIEDVAIVDAYIFTKTGNHLDKICSDNINTPIIITWGWDKGWAGCYGTLQDYFDVVTKHYNHAIEWCAKNRKEQTNA